MAYLVQVARFGLPALFTLALAGACGGQSFGTNGGDGAAGSSSAGSPGQAGTNGIGGKGEAGSAPKAGAATGGSPVGGTGSGGRGPGGPECNAAADSGTCEAYFRSWYHDPATGICRPFVYGGCGGNENRYDSLEACQQACSGGEPNYDACSQASDCVVTGGGCCGTCDSPSISKNDLIAYNRDHLGFESCPDLACAPCALPEPGAGTLSNFIAGCVNQQCTVVDIRESALTACKADTDCRLRYGNGCCESCDSSSGVIAVRNDGSFEKQVCGTEDVACPACARVPAPYLAAVCASGRCAVSQLASTH